MTYPTVQLPQPIPSASGWGLSDFLRMRLTSTPAAGGLARIEFRQLADDELWLIDHAVIACDSSTATELRLYETYADPGRLLSGSGLGNFDEAEYAAGLQIAPSTQLLAEWTGASDGATALLAVQGRIMRRAG